MTEEELAKTRKYRIVAVNDKHLPAAASANTMATVILVRSRTPCSPPNVTKCSPG